ncbi:protein of unknown function [Serratia sp. Tan611]|nr:protein of unknown function [Serratia sp. Tan611]
MRAMNFCPLRDFEFAMSYSI